MISTDRWEYGSIFHWYPYEKPRDVSSPWGSRGAFYGCGRDAFRSLLEYGMATRGWKRMWVPTFFCQDVVLSFVDTGIDVRLYPYAPEDPSPGFEKIDFLPGDVLLRMNFFGLHSSLPLDGVDRSYVEVIDDHTHDPWSKMAWDSDADWCMTSLRKVLPIPDGGVLWSPRGYQLPPVPEVTESRRVASLEKLAAMTLKGLYLDGHPFDREIYRRLSASAEGRVHEGAISGMPEWTRDLLDCFPVMEWRDQRRANFRVLSSILADAPWVKVLQPDDDISCPFSGMLVFDDKERRNYIQSQLASQKIFLSIMWPLDKPAREGIPEEHADFSRRILSTPCDMRYDAHDIRKVGRIIREVGDGYRG